MSADAVLLGFARSLRAAGVAVTADHERTYLRAVEAVGLGQERGVYLAGRATLCSSPDDLDRYDAVYAAWFHPASGRRPSPQTVRSVAWAALADADPGADPRSGVEDDADQVPGVASSIEALRHRDVAELSAAQRAQLAELFARLRPRAPRRRSRRHTAAPRGRVDARRTLRTQLRRFGEPGPVSWRRRGTTARRVVLLIDISGSMRGYADALLRLAHAYRWSAVPVEVFTVGTRLTRVTAALQHRDPDRALVACGALVPDWSGGTRLAEGLRAFLDRWGRRGMARGAVVVVFSDGWERDAPQALGEQARRLRAVAHRVVWVSPHRGKPGYEPRQQGVLAVLPHVDAFVAGHSFAAFGEVVREVADA